MPTIDGNPLAVRAEGEGEITCSRHPQSPLEERRLFQRGLQRGAGLASLLPPEGLDGEEQSELMVPLREQLRRVRRNLARQGQGRLQFGLARLFPRDAGLLPRFLPLPDCRPQQADQHHECTRDPGRTLPAPAVISPQRRLDVLDEPAVIQFLARPGKEIGRLGQALAGRQQEIRSMIVPFPECCIPACPLAGHQVVTALANDVLSLRPAVEQRLMGDPDNGLFILAIAHQQASADQRIDQGSTLRDGPNLLQARDTGRCRALVRSHGDQCADQRRKRVANLRRQTAKNIIRPPGDGPFQSVQRAIGREGEHTPVPAGLVKRFQNKLHQRQRRGVAGSRLMQHVVQSALVRIFLEAEPSRQRRIADHLGNLRSRRGKQFIAAEPVLQFRQHRHFGAAMKEIAAHRTDHPHKTAAGQRRQHCNEGLAHLRVAARIGEELFQLVHDDGESGCRQARQAFARLKTLSRPAQGAANGADNPVRRFPDQPLQFFEGEVTFRQLR